MRTPTPLRLAIAASGLSQREVAAQAGLSEVHLSKLVNGRHVPSLANCVALASAVGRTVEELWPELHADASSSGEPNADHHPSAQDREAA